MPHIHFWISILSLDTVENPWLKNYHHLTAWLCNLIIWGEITLSQEWAPDFHQSWNLIGREAGTTSGIHGNFEQAVCGTGLVCTGPQHPNLLKLISVSVS